jgi:peptidoglycan/LPS O-acetylase OafA/YrhL
VAAGHVSYGIYLWGYPIQQTIVLILGRDIAPGWVLLLSGTVTWVIAFASWRLIEAPALRLKRRLRLRAAPRPTPAV